MGAWIETSGVRDLHETEKSLPTWGRGLKHEGDRIHIGLCESLPTWGRGLKRSIRFCGGCLDDVAPYMGAWIET